MNAFYLCSYSIFFFFVEITIKMKTIVRKPLMTKVFLKVQIFNSWPYLYYDGDDSFAILMVFGKLNLVCIGRKYVAPRKIRTNIMMVN